MIKLNMKKKYFITFNYKWQNIDFPTSMPESLGSAIFDIEMPSDINELKNIIKSEDDWHFKHEKYNVISITEVLTITVL